eukprot:TRINITY_DN7614_c0_g1_i1.p1 TRINITY_DN7614_c0_g1~~TRINITY_DN7614_c0_g1_i1.p1  ORF type:complete len:317 (-),score=26.76 TRINITY_DN7614_c0_g1_i1:184-1068(-)
MAAFLRPCWNSGACWLAACLTGLLWHAAALENTMQCIVRTGEACPTWSCGAAHGPATCEAGACKCKDSLCVGADGVCADVQHISVGSGKIFKIRNARWPDKYLTVGLGGKVDVESDGNAAESGFKLWLLDSSNSSGTTAGPVLLVESSRWPDHVLRAYDNFGLELGHIGVNGTNMGEAGMWVKAAPPGSTELDKTLVMLNPLDLTDYYLWVPDSREKETATVGKHDMGTGSYWFFEPDLPADVRQQLRAYDGPKCEVNCGTAGSNAVISNAAGKRAAAFTAVLGFAGLLPWLRP